MAEKEKKDPQARRNFLKKGLATAAGITLTGVAGISLLKEEDSRKRPNPFEYNIDHFKKIDQSLLTYKQERAISIDYNQYYGIAIDENDNLYISVDQKILIFDRNKSPLSTIDLSEAAYCLECATNGDLYLGMADHVEIYQASGKQKARWQGLGEQAIITSLAIAEDYVYVADAGHMVIWQYDKTGKIIAQIGKKDAKKDIPGFVIPSPFFDVEIDAEGFLWAANTGRHTLENYTKEGALRTSWGYASMAIEGFAGCCNPSHFVIMPDGRFVTAEKGIARIKVYDRLGRLAAVVAGPDDFIEGTVDIDLAIDSQQKIYALDNKKKAVRIFSKKEDIING